MKAIADTFEVACQMIGCDVEIYVGKLEKLKNAKKSASLVNPLHIFSPIAHVGKFKFKNRIYAAHYLKLNVFNFKL